MASFAHEISVRACCRRREEGADTLLDISTAEALFCAELLDPLSRDGTVDTKALVKVLTAGLRSEASIMTAAAVCLMSSTGKVAHDEVSVEDVKRLFRRSFHEHRGSDDRISLATLTFNDTFKAWAVAAGFDATSTANNVDRQQRANNFNDFEELSRLCERGGAQSAICLLKSTWLQEKFAEAQRTGVPFKLPSRNALPPDAAYSGPITKERVYIIALSYCWAGPGQPDPENRLLADVCELLRYLDTSRHFGESRSASKNLVIGNREVLVFWDYPCLYQKSDTSTGGVTLLQLESFQRGLASINVLYGHVDTLCLLCTKSYPVVVRTGYRDSAWPYFEMLVSTLIKDQNRAVDLPSALEWVRRVGQDQTVNDVNRSIYWLFEHVRRATRSLPVGPDTFDAEIVRKHATNGSDVQFLMKKFRETFHALMGPAQKMKLSNIPGPTSHQWQLFLTATLPTCPRLVHIDLSRNEAIRGATLQPFASLRDTLEHLDVSMSAGFGGNLEPLRNLRKLKMLYLFGCVALEGSVEPLAELQDLEMVNVEACFGLVGGLEALSSLPQLKNLNVCDTQLDPAAFTAARRRWREFGAVVGGCRVGRFGDEWTPLVFAANDGQAELARRLLVGRSGRAGVEVDRADKRLGGTPLIMASTRTSLKWWRSSWSTVPTLIRRGLTGTTPLLIGRTAGTRAGGQPAPPERRGRQQVREGETDAALPGCQQRSQGSGGDAPRGWFRQDNIDLVGTHRIVESTGAQPPRGRRPPAVNGRPLLLFFTEPGPAPQSRTKEIGFFPLVQWETNMLHATDTKHVPASVQEATRHLVRGFSVASSVVPHSVVSSLLLLARCRCALFSSLWFRLLHHGGESTCPRSSAPATFPLLPSRRQVAHTIPFPRCPTTERRH